MSITIYVIESRGSEKIQNFILFWSKRFWLNSPLKRQLLERLKSLPLSVIRLLFFLSINFISLSLSILLEKIYLFFDWLKIFFLFDWIFDYLLMILQLSNSFLILLCLSIFHFISFSSLLFLLFFIDWQNLRFLHKIMFHLFVSLVSDLKI